MKTIDLQLTRLTIVSNTLQACEREYEALDDETGQTEVRFAIKELNQVIKFLSGLNSVLDEPGPDICPKCGYNLSDN